ncbi:hypothetical protein [Curtobacterium flaccumfaciens]|uniref:hypothetical protein n=1 Tax=Curtobacterium flaccumfaciens TaxID=2035 RepID=UPI003D9A59A4
MRKLVYLHLPSEDGGILLDQPENVDDLVVAKLLAPGLHRERTTTGNTVHYYGGEQSGAWIRVVEDDREEGS